LWLNRNYTNKKTPVKINIYLCSTPKRDGDEWSRHVSVYVKIEIILQYSVGACGVYTGTLKTEH